MLVITLILLKYFSNTGVLYVSVSSLRPCFHHISLGICFFNIFGYTPCKKLNHILSTLMDLKRCIDRFGKQSNELDPYVPHIFPQDHPNLNGSIHLKIRILLECREVLLVYLSIFLPTAQGFPKSRIGTTIENSLLIHLLKGRLLQSWSQTLRMVFTTF